MLLSKMNIIKKIKDIKNWKKIWFIDLEWCENSFNIFDNKIIDYLKNSQWKTDSIFISLPIIKQSSFKKFDSYIKKYIKFKNIKFIVNDFWVLQYFLNIWFENIYAWRILSSHLRWWIFFENFPIEFFKDIKWVFADFENHEKIKNYFNKKSFWNKLEKWVYFKTQFISWSLICKFKKINEKCQFQCEKWWELSLYWKKYYLIWKNLISKNKKIIINFSEYFDYLIVN